MADNNLNNALSDAIYNFTRMMKEGAIRELGASRLTLLQLKALIFIEKKESARMKEIAENFHVEMPTATSLVNKLCATGLARRKADKSDRRIVKLELTSEGKELLEQAKSAYKKKIDKTLSYLSTAEKESLLIILQKLQNSNL